MCNIEWFWRNFIQTCFTGPINFSKYIIIPNNSNVYIKIYTFVFRYLVLVKSFYGSSKFYPELTRFLVNFLPVSSTLLVCCSAIRRIGNLFAVKHKKLRIKHIPLCVKM
jgi:hypothetical protein